MDEEQRILRAIEATYRKRGAKEKRAQLIKELNELNKKK